MVYTSGKAPESKNFNYNALFKMTDATTEDGVLKAFEWPQGGNNETTDWNKTEHVFTAETGYVGVRMGWNASSKFDGFQLYVIEEAGVDLTELNNEIAAAQAQLAGYEEGTEWYNTLSAAIAEAQAATPADAEAAAAAVSALKAAEQAAALAYVKASAPFADGDYVIQNVETGYFLGGGNDWGTHASLLGKPQWFTLTIQADGTYTLDSHQHNNNATDHFLTTGLYVDGAATNWTIAANGDGFTIANGTNYLAGNGKNATLKTVTDASDAAAQWVFITKADVVAAQASASATNPVDVTAFIKNPEVKRNANTSYYPTWTTTGTIKDAGSAVANCAEAYHSAFSIEQTLTGLKAGLYRLNAQAFYRQDGSDEENMPYVYLNDQQANFPLRTGSENNMAAAYASFLTNTYPVASLYANVEEGGNLTIGARCDNATMWTIFGEFSLTYYGNATAAEVELADYIAAYNEAMAAAQAYVSVDMADKAKEALNTAIAENTVDVATATQESLETATANLKAAVEDAAWAARAAANSKAAAELIAAGNGDFTSFIVNPSFETGNTEGWTSVDGGGAANNGNFGLATGSWFAERWTWGTSATNVLSDGSLTQVIPGLPAGSYTLTAELQNLMQYDESVVPGGYFLDANGTRAEVSAANTYTVEFTLDGTELLTLGAILEGCTGNWVCVDNFRLTYVIPTVPEFEYAATSVLGECYEGLPVTVDLDAVLAAIGASSMDEVTIYSENADGSRVEGVRKDAAVDGWRDAEGSFSGWGDAGYFFVQDDTENPGAVYFVGGMEGKNTDTPVSYTAKLVYVNNSTNAEAVVKITLNYVSLTDYYIVNADLTGTDGWATDGTKGLDGSGIVKCGNNAVFDFYQTIRGLPAGQYKLTAQAAYRYGGDEQTEYDAIQAGTETKNAIMYAMVSAEETVETKVLNRYDGASETDLAGSGSVQVNGLFVPNSSNAVKAWFEAGQYVNEITINLITDGDVTIGIKKTATPDAGDYTVLGGWTLEYLGAPIVGEMEISDLVVETSVEYDTESNYTEKVATLTDEQVQSVLTELGLSSLSEVIPFGYNPSNGEFIDITEAATNAKYDGWHNPEGDFCTWTGSIETAPFCIKYTDGKEYHCWNLATAEHHKYVGYYALTNGKKAVLVKITFVTATAINAVEAEQNAAQVIFDLSGRRLQKAVKGVNIINGKKILVK